MAECGIGPRSEMPTKNERKLLSILKRKQVDTGIGCAISKLATFLAVKVNFHNMRIGWFVADVAAGCAFKASPE